MERLLLTRCHAPTVVNRGNEVVAVVAVDDPAPGPPAQVARPCKTTVEARFPGTAVSAGIGNPYTGAARISTSYAEARHAVDTTTLMSGLGGVVTFAELGISRRRARVRDVADLHEFARDVLGDLLEHQRSHGSDYLATLTVYFNENNSPQRSARRLHTHPNTVAYRVRRIEEITGLSLSSYSDRLMLQVALEIVNGLGEPGMSSFLDRLGERILVCDGAMGTALHAAGNSLDQALPALNLTAADLVGAIHDGYIDAGVDILQTNTFGASRLRLAPSGHGDRVAEINAAGVRIARTAAGRTDREVFVAGSVSPAVTVLQRSTTSAAERTWALREQIAALDGAGVDLLVLEMFGFLTELVEAATVAAEHASVPIVAQATFAADGRTLSGHTPREVVDALAGLPIAVLGINCTLGPQGSLEVATELARHSTLPLSVQPNAGLPRRVSAERLEYEVDPEYFARYGERLVASGARLVGGCCGTTPLHIGAVVKVVQARQQRATRPVLDAVRPREPVAAERPGERPDGPGPVVGAELQAPAAGGLQAALEAAEAVRDSGAQPSSIVPPVPGRGQRSAMNQSVEVAAKLQDRARRPGAARPSPPGTGRSWRCRRTCSARRPAG